MKNNIKRKVRNLLQDRKIILPLGVVAAIITFGLNFSNVKAAGDSTLSFTPLTQSIASGSTFTVDVVATPGTYNIGNIDLALTFDQAKLRLDSITFGGQFTQIIAPVIGSGTATISGQMPTGQMLSSAGTYATLHFTALATVTNSQINVDIANSGIYSEADPVPGNNELSASAISPAQVTVTAPVTYTIGGSISGLSGTVKLKNNGGDELTKTSTGSFTFATPINSGSVYAVSVSSQPTGQTCTVTNGSGTATANVTNVSVSCADIPPNTYTVGGTISGLSGTVVLKNNGADNLNVSANGTFVFATSLADAASYAVTVGTQPTGQTCAVTSGGTGTVAAANVTSVVVTCTTNAFTIGGSISGLSGTVKLKNNGGDELTKTSTGSFTFATAINSGSAYAVSVSSQPTGQTCTVTNGSGTATANVTNVSVSCTNDVVSCSSYTYSEWGTCTNGTQTRTIASSLPNGCTGGVTPVLSQNCSIPIIETTCTSFTYSDWGACQSNSLQSRTITSSLPSGCTGGSPAALSQNCTYQSSSSSSSSSHHKKTKKKSKKSKSSSMKVANAPSSIKRGGVVIQSGANFTANGTAKAYFAKAGGGFYAPQTIRINAKGTFSMAYRVNKPAGKYQWYVVDVKTGKKSNVATYTVK